MRFSPLLKRALIAMAVCLALLVGLSVTDTFLALSHAKQFRLSQAANHARRAQWLPSVLATLTFHAQADLEVWNQGLRVLDLSDRLLSSSNQYVGTTFGSKENNPEVITEFKTTVRALNTSYSQLVIYAPRSALVRRFLSPTQLLKLEKSRTAMEAVTTLFDGSHTYLVLFQNSQELRATGGFMGTYALVTLNEGELERFEVQDIYVPDGQFTGFVEAPVGAHEYLSSGNGLRLPDANWSPDFPTSAQHILPFFSFAGEQNIEGVLAINLPVAEELLRVVGPLTIPDYETTVDADNFAVVARADRDEFFPGSQQKKQFMSAVLNQLIFALEDTSLEERYRVASIVTDNIRRKNILLYSQHPQLQQVGAELGVAGAVAAPVDTNFYLFPVESNVGINKANKDVQRTHTLALGETRSTFSTLFINSNHPPSGPPRSRDEAPHLGYVNYYRLLMLPEVNVVSISLDGIPISTWDEELITTFNQQQLKQVGFLVTIPEQQSKTVSFEFSHPPLPNPTSIFIQKQPGLPPLTYVVSRDGRDQRVTMPGDVHLVQ